MALTEDQRREVREISFEVGGVIVGELRGAFDAHVARLEKAIMDGHARITSDRQRDIELHKLKCETRKKVEDKENQAKGAVWLLRLLWVSAAGVLGWCGSAVQHWFSQGSR